MTFVDGMSKGKPLYPKPILPPPGDGGNVKGKKVYGSYPSLALNTDLEIGGGGLIPQISTDAYFVELALWYGVSRSDLPILFSSIGNFYNTMSRTPPLGFMNLSYSLLSGGAHTSECLGLGEEQKVFYQVVKY